MNRFSRLLRSGRLALTVGCAMSALAMLASASVTTTSTRVRGLGTGVWTCANGWTVNLSGQFETYLGEYRMTPTANILPHHAQRGGTYGCGGPDGCGGGPGGGDAGPGGAPGGPGGNPPGSAPGGSNNPPGRGTGTGPGTVQAPPGHVRTRGPADLNLATGNYEPTFGADLWQPDAGYTWFSGTTYNAYQGNNSSTPVDAGRPNQTHHDSDGPQGFNWMNASQPELVLQQLSEDDIKNNVQLSRIAIVYAAAKRLDFKRYASTDTYIGIDGASGAVVRTTDTETGEELYVYRDRRGNTFTFFGHSAGLATAAHGQLWKVTDSSVEPATANIAFVGDETDPEVASTNFLDDGVTTAPLGPREAFSGHLQYNYAYSGSAIGGRERLTQVQVVDRASPTTVLGQVDYEYYTSTGTDGTEGDLKYAKISTPLSDPLQSVLQVRYFRYYTNVKEGPALAHRLKMVVGFEGMRKLLEVKIYEDIEALSDSDLKPYSDAYFEYETTLANTQWAGTNGEVISDYRINKAIYNGECGCGSSGGSGEYEYIYERNASFTRRERPWGSTTAGENYPTYPGSITAYDWSYERWANRTIVKRPDGTYQIVYFDSEYQRLGEVIASGDPSEGGTKFWVTKFTRDGNGRIIDTFSPEAIDTYNHATGQIDVKVNEGLVSHLVYSTDTHLPGQVSQVWHQAGKTPTGTGNDLVVDTVIVYASGGTRVLQYFGDAALLKPLPVEVRQFHTEGTDPNASGNYDAVTYAYTFYPIGGTDDWVVKSMTTTYPAVDPLKNGEGATTDAVTYYREDGSIAFTKGRDGRYTYTEFDASQMLVKQIQDLTSGPTIADDPTDWGITLPSTGFDLVTTFTYDAQGRADTTTLPNGRVTQKYYTQLLDGRVVNLAIPRLDVGGTTYLYGPASYTVLNNLGRAEASGTIALAGTGPSGEVGVTTTAFSGWINNTGDAMHSLTGGLGTIVHFSTMEYDQAGARLLNTKRYFAAPTTLPGTVATHYDQATYTYDTMGRPLSTTDATDTIGETQYDALGRVIARRTGTNNSGGGSDNMVTTEAMEYDGGADMANSRLTKRTLFVNRTSGDEREITYIYDYRGRLKVVVPPMAPFSVVGYDNRNRRIASATYSSSSGLDENIDPIAEDTNRLSLSMSFFDSRGQSYKSSQFEIDQLTGAINQDSSVDISIDTLNWFSPSGDLIATRGADLRKFNYDTVHRRTHEFTLASIDDADYYDLFDNATNHTKVDGEGEVVLSQTHTVYASTSGNVLGQVTISRHHDDKDPAGGGTPGSLHDEYEDSGYDSEDFNSADLKGRAQITAMAYDERDRMVRTAVYGTNGGSNFTFDSLSVPTSTSTGTILVSKRTYDAAGRVETTIDPKGLVTKSVFDIAGRTAKTIANDVGSPSTDTVATNYTYADGLKTAMWVDVNNNGGNPEAGTDQITTYDYQLPKGSSPGQSAIAANNVLYTVKYPPQYQSPSIQPDADRTVTYAYNAQRQQDWTKDQAGNIIQTAYDDLGRETQRTVSTLISPFDGAVRAVTTTYTPRGHVERLTQYSNTSATTEVDGVMYQYDDAGLLKNLYQDRDSAVDLVTMGHNEWHVEYGYQRVGSTATPGQRSMYRLAGMTYPDSAELSYTYNSASNAIDDDASRVSTVVLDTGTPVTIASYRYNGAATLIEQRIRVEQDVVTSLDNLDSTSPSYRVYPNLDRFDRVIRSLWGRDTSYFDGTYYDVKMERSGPAPGYDDNSNITGLTDWRFTGFTSEYTVDGLNRLTDSTASAQSEDWTLDRLGNFTGVTFGAMSETRTANQANEITGRSKTTPTESFTPVYDLVGNLVNDGGSGTNSMVGYDYTYTYDVFGRLVKIMTKAEDPEVVAEFRYDARGHRIAWKHPLIEDVWYYPVYDHRWRMIAVYKDEGEEDPPSLQERFYYHNAGIGGSGGSSYIDATILRERPQGETTERMWYVQNWRGDVVGMVRSDAKWAEQIRYSAYGRPFNFPFLDVNGSGNSSIDDLFYYIGPLYFTGGPGSDWNMVNGTSIDDLWAYQNDYFSGSDELGGRDRITSGPRGNRKGYAGYEHDEALPSLMLARHRWYRADTGTWTRRDPLGYVDGPNMYLYVSNNPIGGVDPTGQAAQQAKGCCERFRDKIRRKNERTDFQGATFCCDGSLTVCVYRDQIGKDIDDQKYQEIGRSRPRPDDRQNGIDIFSECTVDHEFQHYRDFKSFADCEGRNYGPDGIEEFIPKTPEGDKILACSECKAYKITLDCLKKNLSQCGPPAKAKGLRNACQKYIEDQIAKTEEKIASYCATCGEKPTPDPDKPPYEYPVPVCYIP